MSKVGRGVQVVRSPGSWERSFPYTDQDLPIFFAGWWPPTVFRTCSSSSILWGGFGARHGLWPAPPKLYFAELNLPFFPSEEMSPYSPGSGARGCSEGDAGVQVGRIMSLWARSGELMDHWGLFLNRSWSFHMYWPGAGVLFDLFRPVRGAPLWDGEALASTLSPALAPDGRDESSLVAVLEPCRRDCCPSLLLGSRPSASAWPSAALIRP
mmetsp:Transcript_32515/g.91349  ORF Transcript_32515/g.91349 Transcript_32515/m.91349 type:complete len:211 (-) Transcript_32515:80-712(-)